jgi:hypothetical protein
MASDPQSDTHANLGTITGSTPTLPSGKIYSLWLPAWISSFTDSYLHVKQTQHHLFTAIHSCTENYHNRDSKALSIHSLRRGKHWRIFRHFKGLLFTWRRLEALIWLFHFYIIHLAWQDIWSTYKISLLLDQHGLLRKHFALQLVRVVASRPVC